MSGEILLIFPQTYFIIYKYLIFQNFLIKGTDSGTSLVVQWVKIHAPNAGGSGSIPDRGTRSCMHAATKCLHDTTKAQRSLNK